jgi:hypothetical protein
MAISFVGSVTGQPQGVSGGAATSISLASLSLQEGDLLIATCAADDNFVSPYRIEPSDWQNAGGREWFPISETSSTSPEAHVLGLFCGATPPSTAEFYGPNDGSRDAAVVIQAFRGVDKRVFDVQVAAWTTGSNIPSVTTQTNGAWVVGCYALDDRDTTVDTYPLGYSNTAETNTGNASTGFGATVAMCSKAVATAGSENPGELIWGASDSNKCLAVVLLPDQDVVDGWSITEVGRVQTEVLSGSTNNSISLPTLLENDIVLVMTSADDNYVGSGVASPVNTTGYTSLVGSSGSVDHHVEWKRMGSTPDTTISMDGPSSTYDAQVSILCLRGVNTTTAIDVAYSENTNSETCPTVTTVTDEALVIRGQFSHLDAEATCRWPVGYAGHGATYADKFGASFNEAAFGWCYTQQDTAGATGTEQLFGVQYGSKVSFTLALRPAVVSGVTGTGAITFGGVTVSGSGTVARDATGAVTLPGIVASGTGAIARDATGAITLPALTVSGTAEREIPGTGAIDLGSLLLAGSGTVGAAPITGAGAVTLGAIVAAGIAERSVTASGAITLAALTMSGAGTIARDATGAITLPAAVISGLAERVIPGSGAITLPAAEVAGQAAREVPGIGSVTLAGVVVAGTGTTAPAGATITGTGALTLPAALVSGIAERSIAGTGALVLPTLTLAGTAERAVTGAGTITLPVTVIAGATERTVTGTGALTIPAALLSGSAVLGEFITGRVVYAGASVTTSTLGGSGNSSTIDDGSNSSTLGTMGPNQTADEE